MVGKISYPRRNLSGGHTVLKIVTDHFTLHLAFGHCNCVSTISRKVFKLEAWNLFSCNGGDEYLVKIKLKHKKSNVFFSYCPLKMWTLQFCK